jgi:hypothetical protein
VNNPNFSEKELDVIRQIAIQLYNDTDHDGKATMNYRFQVIAEATYVYLKRMDMLKDAT